MQFSACVPDIHTVWFISNTYDIMHYNRNIHLTDFYKVGTTWLQVVVDITIVYKATGSQLCIRYSIVAWGYCDISNNVPVGHLIVSTIPKAFNNNEGISIHKGMNWIDTEKYNIYRPIRQYKHLHLCVKGLYVTFRKCSLILKPSETRDISRMRMNCSYWFYSQM